MIGCVMNDELERIWKEADVTLSGYYLGIRLEGHRKTMTNLSQIASVSAQIRIIILHTATGNKTWLYFTAVIMMMKKKIITYNCNDA
jgi:hypothetical protein